ncbi:MAG: undecaprenyldiphospho-muramoylpentapeptide beta-N-acetylglucosaminyltransferase [Bacteroidaceae bacterium]|jgi:UDP-N-acetylglucosamine--N-acetylmuramyl-(pentapeptide) pyrophosphoryl-undecaprenol N-acetylglucosamine transferase|nr:undecaprenyldiphospho-muramoylpentapeptide beta-N-acetylglucosaminyltransferase [Bacteroidaceae bacterium]
MKNPRIIISGGGTGGHIFPAVSIANALKKLRPEAEILFVGAKDRMEMQRVPQAGYKIIGLPVKGLIRPLWSPKNIGILIDFLKSKREVKKIIKEFKPDVAVGVGGYASAATLNAAYDMGVPCLIQEQNSFAGLTNKTLAKKASKICVAYDGMERFFPADRILLTGNPIRQSLLNPELDKTEALAEFGLTSSKPVILLIGGSLGARTLNNSVLKSLELIRSSNVQFIWQTGSYYKESIANELEKCGKPDNLYVTDFIRSMDKAYKAADLVISRAGASSISELCLLGKPSILVPSPNVAEDHQTHNAMALVRKEAALLVKDIEAEEKLIPLAVKTVNDQNKLHSLGANALAMALTDSDVRIAEEVLQLIKND